MAAANSMVRAWTKPALTTLGTLKDVAGPTVVNSNGVSTGFANS